MQTQEKSSNISNFNLIEVNSNLHAGLIRNSINQSIQAIQWIGHYTLYTLQSCMMSNAKLKSRPPLLGPVAAHFGSRLLDLGSGASKSRVRKDRLTDAPAGQEDNEELPVRVYAV